MQQDRLRSIDSAEVAGKRVLVRADLNVPMADGEVTDATRIERLLPTLRGLAERGAKVIVMSHFGRPKGARKPEFSLAPVAARMRTMLNGTSVAFADDCVGEAAEAGASGLAAGEVVVLENLRFHAGEEANDKGFARALSALGDLYVNDAFSCAHRAHASTEAIAHLLPAYAGPLMMAEISALRTALDAPERPVAAIVGGAKVSTKIPVLSNLAGKVDALVIGGGMANTFLHAKGVNVGKSLCEPEFAETVSKVTAAAADAGCEIVLPVDAVVADEFREGAASDICPVDAVPADAMILDVGPASVDDLVARLGACRTVLWNGPLGAFEVAPFGEGTFAVAREAARLTGQGSMVTVAGGGDTVAALNAAGVTDQFTYVSTAGGAFLEWLEGRELPGVAALENRNG
ncbi:MAG: phosphoglycerate kinase [Hyphomicrobiales bacterium]|nr:phosphoglycerate kinase [Hyphomicrobiales bacterium]